MGQDPSPIKLQMLGGEQLHTEGVRHVQGLCEAFACLPSRPSARPLGAGGWGVDPLIL